LYTAHSKIYLRKASGSVFFNVGGSNKFIYNIWRCEIVKFEKSYIKVLWMYIVG